MVRPPNHNDIPAQRAQSTERRAQPSGIRHQASATTPSGPDQVGPDGRRISNATPLVFYAIRAMVGGEPKAESREQPNPSENATRVSPPARKRLPSTTP